VDNELPNTLFGPERENKGKGIVLPVVAIRALAPNLSG
jgi:hypothetical protein